MNRLRSSLAVFLTTCLLFQSACYDWKAIKPVELPKLNAAVAQAPTDYSEEAPVVSVRTVDVQGEDGTLVSIDERFDLRITLKTDGIMLFKNPVSVERQGQELVIRGSNLAVTRVPIENIVRAEVTRPSTVKSVALCLAVAAAAYVAVVVALAAILASRDQPSGR